MNLQHLTDMQLIADTNKLVKAERENSIIILHHLREIHKRRLYSDLKFTSMFHYCVKGLHYSEGQAYRHLKAAKLLDSRPELEDKIIKGQTSIATMAQVQTHFDKNNTTLEQKTLIIDETIHLSRRECESKLFNFTKEVTPKKPEHTKRESCDHSRVSLNMDDTLMKKLEHIRNLMGHKDIYTYEKLLNIMADDFIKHRDPASKEKKAETQTKKKEKLTHSIVAGEVKRKYIPEKVRRMIYEKSKYRCMKCSSSFALELDHIKPVCHGGGNNPENLRILCRSCNQREAIKKISRNQMSLFLDH